MTYRAVNADVALLLGDVLVETGRSARGAVHSRLVPRMPAPFGWGERSGASWAGVLKTVGRRLLSMRPEYAGLDVTATDGHRTWSVEVAISVHLLTEKIISAERGRASAGRKVSR